MRFLVFGSQDQEIIPTRELEYEMVWAIGPHIVAILYLIWIVPSWYVNEEPPLLGISLFSALFMMAGCISSAVSVNALYWRYERGRLFDRRIDMSLRVISRIGGVIFPLALSYAVTAVIRQKEDPTTMIGAWMIINTALFVVGYPVFRFLLIPGFGRLLLTFIAWRNGVSPRDAMYILFG